MSEQYYTYCSEDGYQVFGTKEEAVAHATAILDEYRDWSGDGWPETVEQVEWGVMYAMARATEVDRRETPEGPFDYSCDYQLVSDEVEEE